MEGVVANARRRLEPDKETTDWNRFEPDGLVLRFLINIGVPGLIGRSPTEIISQATGFRDTSQSQMPEHRFGGHLVDKTMSTPLLRAGKGMA